MTLQQKKLSIQALILMNLAVLLLSIGNDRAIFWLTVTYVVLNMASIKLTFEMIEKHELDWEHIKEVRTRHNQYVYELNNKYAEVPLDEVEGFIYEHTDEDLNISMGRIYQDGLTTVTIKSATLEDEELEDLAKELNRLAESEDKLFTIKA